MLSGVQLILLPFPLKTPRDVIEIDALSRYKAYMIKEFSHLRGMKERIVYDCGNGVAGLGIGGYF